MALQYDIASSPRLIHYPHRVFFHAAVVLNSDDAKMKPYWDIAYYVYRTHKKYKSSLWILLRGYYVVPYVAQRNIG